MDMLTESMYRDAMIIEDIHELVSQSAMNLGDHMGVTWKRISTHIADLIYCLGQTDIESANELLNAWKETGEGEKDRRNLCAKAERYISPLIIQAIDKLYNKNDIEIGQWLLLRSTVGFYTIRNIVSGGYIHSPYDPMEEAAILAGKLYNYEMEEIHILGSGLGYLPYQLWIKSERSIKIHIYEEDKDMINLAIKFGVLDWVDKDQLHIHSGNDIDFILRNFCEKAGANLPYFVSDWKVYTYKGNGYDAVVNRLAYNQRMASAYDTLWKINVRENLKRDHYPVYLLKNNLKFQIKEYAVVSSGPSLNNCITFLKDNRERMVIIAVNSCLKRLFDEGIIPDVIVMLDPTPVLKTHLDGVIEYTENIPLVTVSTGSRHFISLYKGKAYYADDIDPSDTFEWRFGGTVSSLALDLAYYLGATRIYLIGSDLSMPQGKNYADGLVHDSDEDAMDRKDEYPYVKSVDGNMVATTRRYMGYIEILEEQIRSYPEVEVYNMSKNGALIQGAKNYDKSAE